MLASFGATLTPDTGRFVNQSNAGLCLVLVLSTGAAARESLRLQIIVFDFDLDVFVNFWGHLYSREGCLPRVAGTKRAYSDQAMNTFFPLQIPVRIFANNLDGGILNPGFDV